MKSVAVFCGSSDGRGPEFVQLARSLGHLLAAQDIALVYGGGRVGLMGAIADAVMAAGGRAIGVIPQALVDRELAHTGISELHITASMHERKAMMEREADGFIALPGGFGTLDEFCEILTWGQLGIHRKPCGILDTETGFFRHLLAFANDAAAAGFVKPEHLGMLLHETDPATLLDRMRSWIPAPPKWTDAPLPSQ
ncbi:MAG TPA: TIGR00730 family Rossman fold protein [Thermomicrobiales bacterium]|nr:TIGR00730 family Rossman fold protein [Thermomicrobiales bacterium]